MAQGGPEITTISISAVLILTMVAIIITALLYRKQKKSGKVTKLVHLVDSTKAVLKSKKRITAGLSAIALLASAGTLTTLLANAGKSNTNAVEEDGLTLDVTGGDITIEVADEPVFAILPVELTVKEATQAGYTLTAYTDNTDLVSTTDSSKVIPMITLPEAGELSALTDNTYGLALGEKPTTKDAEVYMPLSTNSDAPTILKTTDYEHTEANDTTTIYYGFYITPDTPYGTYKGSDITYNVEANKTATVTFNGNGLYFNNDPSLTTNVMRYVPDAVLPETVAYSHTLNVDDAGEQEGMYPLNSGQTFVYRFDDATKVYVDFVSMGGDGCGPGANGYFTFWDGAFPNYTAADYTKDSVHAFGNETGKYDFASYSSQSHLETDVDGDAMTIAYATSNYRNSYCGNSNHGYGYYAVVTAKDAEGGNAHLIGNSPVVGEYITPSSNDARRFLGWSTNQEGTGVLYSNLEDIVLNLDLTAGDVDLYAISEPAFIISYNGNGADSTTNMDNVEQYTTNVESTSQVDLLASNFKRDGYGFAGWSTDSNAWEHFTDDDASNNPTIYGPNQMITVDPSTSTKLNLYAVWVPAETDAQGSPVSLQNWQGCSSLTATTYDDETGTLKVAKNTITALTDSRDGEVYTIARLADGKCWMTENLRLDNDATISTTNTNNPIVEEGTTNVVIKNNDGNTSNHLSPNSNSWCTDYNPECIDQSNLNTNNVTNTATSAFSRQDFTNGTHEDLAVNIYSYSNYYNWYSATAGNGTYDKSSGEVAGDICPAGWHLPYGGGQTSEKGNTSGGFYYLNQQMGGNTSSQGSNNWRSFPNNFVYSGYWYGSSAGSRGNNGYYWSSTAYNTGSAYYLGFSSDYVDPGTNGNGKSNGYSVRCVAPTE